VLQVVAEGEVTILASRAPHDLYIAYTTPYAQHLTPCIYYDGYTRSVPVEEVEDIDFADTSVFLFGTKPHEAG